VAVDQRGHGRSARLAGPVTVADWAADLTAFVERQDPPVTLVGHSLGGAVAAELIAARPELADRAVLEDPPAISRSGDVSWLERLEGELIAAHTDLEAEVSRELLENAAWHPEDARQDVEGKQLADRERIVASFRSGVGTRVLDLVPRLSAPVLYLLAAEDRSVFPQAARDILATALPDGSRIEVMDAGHTIHRDRFEDYVAILGAWLEAPA
jgi:pimeloyl-ACP methyl ester carboxylesterase